MALGSTGPSTARTWAYYGAAVLGVVLVAIWGDLERIQIVAAGLFAGILFGALFFWTYRLAFAFFGVGLMLLFAVTTVDNVVAFAGLDIVLFLVGMMVVVGFLEERRFFEFIVDGIVDRFGGSGRGLTVALMLMAALSAALVDEVTSILFMAATVFNISTRLNMRPLPLLMMVIFATNVGSSATVVGNPVGVMIALRGGLTFADFLRWATPIAALALFLTVVICLVMFRRYIRDMDAALRKVDGVADSHERHWRQLMGPGVLFALVILGLVTHTQVEKAFGLEKNSMLLGSALLGAGVALVVTGARARELVEKRVDWWTLSFFLILFASVGALNFVGVTDRIAQAVVDGSGDDERTMFIAFMSVAAVLSALMDNVLAVAMFIPVVNDLGSLGVYEFPMWWALLFAGTFFGNLTMIGSTANIVAIGMLERRGLDHVTFMQWLRYGVVVAVPTILLAMGLLLLQFYH